MNSSLFLFLITHFDTKRNTQPSCLVDTLPKLDISILVSSSWQTGRISAVTLQSSLPWLHKNTQKVTDVFPDVPVQTWRKDNNRFLQRSQGGGFCLCSKYQAMQNRFAVAWDGTGLRCPGWRLHCAPRCHSTHTVSVSPRPTPLCQGNTWRSQRHR